MRDIEPLLVRWRSRKRRLPSGMDPADLAVTLLAALQGSLLTANSSGALVPSKPRGDAASPSLPADESGRQLPF
jgi:hypothetical protein